MADTITIKVPASKPKRVNLAAEGYGSAITGSKSRLGATAPEKARPGIPARITKLQVLNKDGVDVTPRRLCEPVPQTPQTPQTQPDDREGDHAAGAADSKPQPAPGFGRAPSGKAAPLRTVHTSGSETGGALVDGEFVRVTDALDPVAPLSLGLRMGVRPGAKEVAPITDQELNTYVELVLTETETISLLDLPNIWVPPTDPEHTAVAENRTRYAAALETVRSTPTMFASHGAQTLNCLPKDKESQAVKPPAVSSGVQVSEADLHDTHTALAALQTRIQLLGNEQAAALAEKLYGAKPAAVVTADHVAADAGRDTDAGDAAPVVRVDPVQTLAEILAKESAIVALPDDPSLESGELDGENGAVAAALPPGLVDKATLVERILTENLIEAAAVAAAAAAAAAAAELAASAAAAAEAAAVAAAPADGADGNANPAAAAAPPPTPAIDTSLGVGIGTLRTLWTYRSPLVAGRPVTCMHASPVDPSILAVGYGGTPSSADGLVLCWSSKNTQHPERVYAFSCAVAAVQLATTQPHFLAIGLVDGAVHLCDVSSTSPASILNSGPNDIGAKHTHPVAALAWASLAQDDVAGGEHLISVAADGHVLRWNLQKGLEGTTLMRVKRLVGGDKQQQATPSDQPQDVDQAPKAAAKPMVSHGHAAFLARQGGPMSMALSPANNDIYLVGTEDGVIHKCGVAYSDQFLSNFFGHSGPVYTVQHSPLERGLFLSASADWSVRLWRDGKPTPVAVLQNPSKKAFNDAAWSLSRPGVVASLSGSALLVWSLAYGTVDPALSLTLGAPLTRVLAAAIAPDTFLVGDATGTVHALRLAFHAD